VRDNGEQSPKFGDKNVSVAMLAIISIVHCKGEDVGGNNNKHKNKGLNKA